MRCMPLLAAALVGGLLAGCSDPDAGKFAVSGTIKLKGAPIPDGTIVLFEPLDNQDTAGNVTVSAGEYSIPRPYGLRAGKYLVRITAGDG